MIRCGPCNLSVPEPLQPHERVYFYSMPDSRILANCLPTSYPRWSQRLLLRLWGSTEIRKPGKPELSQVQQVIPWPTTAALRHNCARSPSHRGQIMCNDFCLRWRWHVEYISEKLLKPRCLVKTFGGMWQKANLNWCEKRIYWHYLLIQRYLCFRHKVNLDGNIFRTWLLSLVSFYDGVSLRSVSALVVARRLPIAPNLVKKKTCLRLTTHANGQN